MMGYLRAQRSICCFTWFYDLLTEERRVMAIERTLSIIKPDAVAKNVIGKIYSRFETNGLKIIASRMAWLSSQEAGEF